MGVLGPTGFGVGDRVNVDFLPLVLLRRTSPVPANFQSLSLGNDFSSSVDLEGANLLSLFIRLSHGGNQCSEENQNNVVCMITCPPGICRRTAGHNFVSNPNVNA